MWSSHLHIHLDLFESVKKNQQRPQLQYNYAICTTIKYEGMCQTNIRHTKSCYYTSTRNCATTNPMSWCRDTMYTCISTTNTYNFSKKIALKYETATKSKTNLFVCNQSVVLSSKRRHKWQHSESLHHPQWEMKMKSRSNRHRFPIIIGSLLFAAVK